ncbi:protein NYNRIN-like isoform 1-T3 [Spheniscus humboldti]
MVVAPVVLDRTKLIATLSPKSRYFSVVDLANSSFAIPLAAGSRARFAFTFWDQQYLFTRLPQGFHSTTSIVHRRVAQMLSQLARGDQPWVFSYVDDILIAGKSQKETKARTRRVLKLIKKTGFKAKFEKAQLVQPKVDYLGMTIGAEGREIQASKLEAISKAPCPQDVHSLRLLLGQFGSLQDHIPGYWELARPLHRLTTEQVGWEWGPEQEQALSRLKHAVLAAPTLRFPDKSQPFVIRLTTSKEVVGAALLQEDERGRLVPVGHSSHILKDHKVSYLPQEKGCLAAVWAVQAFKTLTGPAPILIQMPHSPWKYLLWGEALGSRGTNPHPARWTLLLVNGGAMARGPQPERGHPPSTLVPAAPPLRLLPSHVPKANVWFTASEKVCSVGFAAANLEERWLLGVAEGGSVPDAELVALGQLLCRHRCSSPLYLYTGCWSLVERLQSQVSEWERGPWASPSEGPWPSILQWVHANPGMLHIRYVGGDGSEDPEEREWSQKVGRRARAMSGRAVSSQQIWEPSKHEKQEIIAQCHSCLHEGVQGTLARVRQVAPWEGDSGQVARWVQNCLSCAAGGDGAGRVLPQRAEGPWSQLQLGYISSLPETEEGHRSLLVVEDEFSGWVEAFPMRERTAEKTAEVLREEVFARYGTPRAIRLPHVPRFLRDPVWLVMAASGTELPWDILQSGQAGPATAALQRLAQGAGKEWAKMLPLILAGIRSIWAQEAVLTPYQIIFGFPLEMRWGCEGGVCPQGNVLPWLSRLQEDGAGYKHRTEAALLRGRPEGDAP